MRLHSPAFEKGLRRRVRKTVRSSAQLRREYRAANKLRKHYQIQVLARPGLSIGFGILVWQAVESTRHTATGLAAIALWGFGFIFLHERRLMTCLYASNDLLALLLLPVAESTIFRWELRKFFRGALWSYFDLLCGYSAVAIWGDFSVWRWLAVIPIAFVAWVEIIALAALCVVRMPRLPNQLISNGLILILFGLFVVGRFVGATVLAIVDRAGPALNVLLPTGWPGSLLEALLPGGHWEYFVALVPIAGLIWTIRNSFARLQLNYQFVEPVRSEVPDRVPGTEAESRPAAGTNKEAPQRVGLTAIEEIIRSRQFLVIPSWPQRGWFEKSLWGWLSVRDRALIEFVFPNGVSLSAPWKKIFRNLGITCLAAFVAGLVGPVLQYSLLALGLFVTGCQVLLRVYANGRAFQPVPCSGVNVPLYAGYAIGFRELANVLIKYSLVQAPLVIAFAAAASVAAFLIVTGSIADGAWFGLKAGGLILTSRLILIAVGFSSGTNDTAFIRLGSLFRLVVLLFLALGYLGLAGTSLFLPQPSVAWLLWSLAALDAYAFYWVYSWFYRGNCFDLMTLPRQ